jgi:hypothetical protein
MSSGIFVQFFECKILMLAEVESVEAEGVIRLTGGRPPGRQPPWTTANGFRNNREDDDGFEYFRNWLTFVVTVASWIFYVANGRKINSPSGNFLTKIIIFCFK